MFMRVGSTLVVSLALFTVIGCTSTPIHNVNNAAVTHAAGKALSADQVRQAIVRAGAALGWQIKDDGPGKLTGMLQLRKHTAVVDVPYSSNSYSINYKSSVNLDEKDGKIHKNYNGWIQNLTQGINAQLSAL
jgi:type II secretory pathway component PulK